MSIKWRFASRYGDEIGLDTSDLETFKKDPNASLAREIAQNSIDAAKDEEPVLIEFKLFEIDRNNIPGVDELSEEISLTANSVKDDDKDKKTINSINKAIQQNILTCLRISDFNTKGLIGVSTNDKETPFYNLTKGSGVSRKTGTAGGSKGIGKFATFVTSSTNTVFYSTITTENEKGYIGICKLRSRPVNDDPDLLTEGKGYYAEGERNLPILEELNLDPSFNRNGETGTDVYIIGFKEREDWKEVIVAKILESFMVAIIKNRLVVKVEDIIVSADTVSNILYQSDILSKRGKKERKDIEAQYELLTQSEENGVFNRDFYVNGDCISIYVKKYSAKNTERATKQCVMVRHPYMKIKHTTGHSFLPYSALCIIHQNELNKRLRDIENPQHDAWEIKRLDDEPEEKKITKMLKREMEDSIDSYIEEILQLSVSKITDMEGAWEYLPSDEDGDLPGEDNEKLSHSENVEASNPQRVNKSSVKTSKVGNESENYDFDTGDVGDEEGYKVPSEGGEIPNPNPNPEHEPKDEDRGSGEGDKPILKKTMISGMKYKLIIVNKNASKYNVVFTSQYTESKCELALRQFGANQDKYPINIINATINGQPCEIVDGKIVNFSLNKGDKYTFTCEVDVKEMFAGEVVLYAYR